MDFFKLLTRSTNLQKKGTHEKLSRSVPSAVASESASIYTENSSIDEQGARATKRRKTGLKTDANAQPASINSDGAHPTSSSNAKSGPSKDVAVQRHTSEASIAGSRLNETECRRILKEQHLKITLLDIPTRLDGKQQKDKSKGKPKTSVIQPLLGFDEMQSRYRLAPSLARNIAKQGYRIPTQVQMASIPLLLDSPEHAPLTVDRPMVDFDLLTIAPTGSGKTMAFLIPTIQRLIEARAESKTLGMAEPPMTSVSSVRAIVLVPTHELVEQVLNEARKLVKETGIRVSAFKRGMRLFRDHESEIPTSTSLGGAESTVEETGPTKADLLICTPGPLHNAIQSTDGTNRTLPELRFLIFDEADLLFDDMFRDASLAVWRAASSPQLRTSFWSATIGSSIETLVMEETQARTSPAPNTQLSTCSIARLVVGLKDNAVSGISHRLIYAATERGKLHALRQLMHPSAPTSPTEASLQPPYMIFTQTVERAMALHSELMYDIPTQAGGSTRLAVLHTKLSETARSAIMTRLRNGEIWILIATDMLSRGVDFLGMNGVVNYDIPTTAASYVHRVGRTARQGRTGGIAITIYTKDDLAYLKTITKLAATADSTTSANQRDISKTWLLENLPTPTKRLKHEMKRRGVETRRPRTHTAPENRISTKSGYDRRRSNNRRHIDGRQPRVKSPSPVEWNGIEE